MARMRRARASRAPRLRLYGRVLQDSMDVFHYGQAVPAGDPGCVLPPTHGIKEAAYHSFVPIEEAAREMTDAGPDYPRQVFSYSAPGRPQDAAGRVTAIVRHEDGNITKDVDHD